MLILFYTILFCFLFSFAQAQQTVSPPPQRNPASPISQAPIPPNDVLKAQIQDLSAKILHVQQALQSADTPEEKQSVIKEIEERQVEALRLSASFVERFAQGAKATETILSALEAGVSIGELSSPFVSSTAADRINSWFNKWGKFVPAVVTPTVAFSLNQLNSNQKLASLPIGLSVTNLISAIYENKKDKAIVKSLTSIQSTLDLFDLNRLVYNDIQKLKAYISSATKADSTLPAELISYWENNKDLTLMPDPALRADPRFPDYINTSQIYISRFQVKLTKVKFVLDHVEGMISSYYERELIKNYNPQTADKVQTETKFALDKLVMTYANFKNNWEELQGRFYQISPAQLRKLDSYYQLETMKLEAKTSL